MRKQNNSFICLFVAININCYSQNYPPEVTNIKIGETNLPIVFINTLGHEINRDKRVSAIMKIINNENGVNYDDTITFPNQIIDYQGYVGIRYRGNSSFENQNKKPYSFKLLTDSYEKGGIKKSREYSAWEKMMIGVYFHRITIEVYFVMRLLSRLLPVILNMYPRLSSAN